MYTSTAPGPLGDAWITRNATSPEPGVGILSGIDSSTTLLPSVPVFENPVAITLYCCPAPHPTEVLKASVDVPDKSPSSVSFPEGTVV